VPAVSRFVAGTDTRNKAPLVPAASRSAGTADTRIEPPGVPVASRPLASADRQTGVQRNLDRVSLALEDIGRLIARSPVTPYDEMVVRVETLRGLLGAGPKPLVAVRLDAGSRRRPDLGRAANRLFLAIGDLRITARGIPDRRLRVQVLETLDEVETQQWTLRDALGLPHSLTADEAIRHQ
jgi:hypothetical protein